MEEYDPKRLSTRIQMLATLVATATYAAGFNPPGGVWQADIHDAAGHLPGDPMMRSTHYFRYAVFFYCNAIAFTLSLIIVVVTLFVNAYPKGSKERMKIKWYLGILMAAAMVAFTVAYGAGACRTKLTIIWYCSQVPFPFFFVMYLAFARWREEKTKSELEVVDQEHFRAFQKLMVPLSMFALTITYVAGLSTPGGFWDSAEGGHRPGDAILGDRFQGKTVRGFLTLNTTAFLASLYALSLLIVHVKKLRKVFPLFCLLALSYLLIGLLGAYIIGNSRGRVNWPLYGVVFSGIVMYVVVHVLVMKIAGDTVSRTICGCAAGTKDEEATAIAEDQRQPDLAISSENNEEATRQQRLNDDVATTEKQKKEKREKEMEKKDDRRRRQAYLVQMMAGLAVAITYQAGLYPPGGLWAANSDGYTAGDPILLTTHARRYKGFYYCNSVSFVASLLVAMFLAHKKFQFLHNHHALEAAMLLDMLGLVGAYAIGSCRDQVSTLYVAGLGGAGVVYVFVHVSYFTLGDTDDRGAGAAGTEGDNLPQDQQDGGVENLGGRFLLFAILIASITYQAGLTPPGGFLLKDDAQSGHHAGDPVLLYNYPRRYRAFFYCNSVSFMLSIVLILLLVNPNQYRTAIKSHALTVCSAVSYVCLMGAFAAGSTQHLTGSYFIFVLAGLPSLSSAILLIRYLKKTKREKGEGDEHEPSQEPGASGSEPSGRGIFRHKMNVALAALKLASKGSDPYSEYLMTLAILVASATYPAGLDPPGGSWQGSSDGHEAGNPVMHDSRRQRYLAFFIGNSASFFASIMLILVLLFVMLLRHGSHDHKTCSFCLGKKWVNGALVSLQCIGFLVAYAAGSSRHWKTSAHIGTLVSAVLLFVVIHVSLSVWQKQKPKPNPKPKPKPKPAEENQLGQGSDHSGHTAR